MTTTTPTTLLVLNAGSSSLKFAVYAAFAHAEPRLLWRGQYAGLDQGQAQLKISHRPPGIPGGDEQTLDVRNPSPLARRRSDSAALSINTPSDALTHLLDWLEQQADVPPPTLIGHRVVHGGSTYTDAVRITPDVMATLQTLIPLAPLHQPHNLKLIHACSQALPAARQIACFDTAFHHTQPMAERRLALPRHWHDTGVMRYGFHGLSYEYIAETLVHHLDNSQTGRVIVAHLGQGTSLAALGDGQSLATTMGFTALDGLPMGTRCGALDPGVVLYLMQEHGMSADAISNLLYSQSGLLGLSGISSDMRVLLEQEEDAAAARDAIAVFIHRCVREIGALIAVLGGLDHLVFTGGMGEHANPIRERICQHLGWLGLHLDRDANAQHRLRIDRNDSSSAVWVIPTDEELMIARHCVRLDDPRSSDG